MKLIINHKRIENLDEIIKFLLSHSDGEHKITISSSDSSLTALKRLYHAMIDELADYAGYRSRKERDLFKEQIKVELGNESLAEMTETRQVHVKLEELHQLAATHYSYLFKPFKK